MSLRMRLFTMMGGLVALLVFGQWWWIRGLTRDLSSEVDQVAVWVGNHVASALVEERQEPCVGEGCAKVIVTQTTVERRGASVTTTGERVFVFQRDQQTLPTDRRRADDATRPSSPPVSMAPAPSSAAALDAMRNELEEQGFRVRMGSGIDDDASLVAVHDVKIAVEPEPRDRHLVLRLHSDQAHGRNEWVHAAEPQIRRIPIPQRGIEAKLERFTHQLLLGSAGLLSFGLLLAALIAHRVATPMRRLSEAAQRVGDGALGTQVSVAGSDREVVLAVDAFNRMSSRLAELDARSRALAARQHLGEIGEIARGLAHTLRNPLNALGLSVDALVARVPTTADDAQGVHTLGAAAKRQIRRIDRAIRSFLTLASQGGGATEAVDIATLARDVALEAHQDAVDRRVAVRVDATDDLPTLAAVAPELRAVLQALVVNAVDASPDEGVVDITLTSEDGDEPALRITVADRGPGLPTHIRERLFTPHLSTKPNGSGMGLFLAQRITTTRYGGQLRLDPREGGGTTAVLTLHPRRDEATS